MCILFRWKRCTIDQATGMNLQGMKNNTVGGEMSGGFEHRGMLNLTHVELLVSRSQNRQVVGLGCTTGEDYFMGKRAEEVRYGLASSFEREPGPGTGPVGTGWVAGVFRRVTQHRLRHQGVQWGGAVMVQINAAGHGVSLQASTCVLLPKLL